MQENLFHLLMDEPGSASSSATAMCEASGRVWSYDALNHASAEIAGVLQAAGVAKGDRVVAQVGKSVAALALYLAVLRLGATYLPLNTDYTPVEVERFIADAQPVVVIASRVGLDALIGLKGEGALAQHGVKRSIALEADGTGELSDLAAAARPYTEVQVVAADDLAAILYTSGTTGRSKGAMLTHANLVFITRTLTQLWDIQPSDTLLHALPMFHAHGLFIAMGPMLQQKAKVVLLPHFSVDAVIARLPEATVFMGVPTFYSRLVGSAQFDRGSCANIRLFTSGSAPLSADLFKAFKERSGHTILERYGLTETTIVSANPLDGERVPGTVGFSLPGVEVRIASGAASRDGVGELEVKGANVFKGYWKMPEQTAKELTDDGFFRTGDTASIAADGRITLVGRSKDLIITGGYNVYPREVEEVLCGSAGVRDAAVVGVSHPDFGEGVIAVIECESNGQRLSEPELIQTAARVLAKYKVPKRIFFVDALPRNTMGKVLKADLRKTYSATFGA